MPGARSSYFKGSHVPIKRELFMYVEVPILTGSSKVREHLGLMVISGGPPLREPTCTGTSPTSHM